ncbi:hypothetical protein MNBD_GAMMA15-1110 [hydrothermal vent metagenome]|uniref:Uncharacterized protein n=1 Tax=hydrothermal vent metagenome TaxID=652676 RepID=A0A3B0YF78_9ZZZZ
MEIVTILGVVGGYAGGKLADYGVTTTIDYAREAAEAYREWDNSRLDNKLEEYERLKEPDSGQDKENQVLADVLREDTIRQEHHAMPQRLEEDQRTRAENEQAEYFENTKQALDDLTKQEDFKKRDLDARQEQIEMFFAQQETEKKAFFEEQNKVNPAVYQNSQSERDQFAKSHASLKSELLLVEETVEKETVRLTEKLVGESRVDEVEGLATKQGDRVREICRQDREARRLKEEQRLQDINDARGR